MTKKPTPTKFLEAIRSDSAAFAAAASRGLDSPVPTCPGWTARDLVLHTGRVHRGKEKVVRERLQNDELEIDKPSGDLLDWFIEGADQLVDTLKNTEPEAPCWSWHPPDQTAGFWYRRMAHETLIHRVDAELAQGSISDVDPEIAEDGVDEGLRVFIEGYPPWADVKRGDGVIRLSTGSSHWHLQIASFSGTTRSGRSLKDIPTVLLNEVAKDWECEVRGEPVALDLWLWGRGPVSDLVIEGDASLATQLREIAANST